jgi:hypothetical protein
VIRHQAVARSSTSSPLVDGLISLGSIQQLFGALDHDSLVMFCLKGVAAVSRMQRSGRTMISFLFQRSREVHIGGNRLFGGQSRLLVEPLEPRQLLSAAAGGEVSSTLAVGLTGDHSALVSSTAVILGRQAPSKTAVVQAATAPPEPN